MMQKIYDERVIYKKKMIKAKKEFEKTGNKKLQDDISAFNNIQMARKIQLNLHMVPSATNTLGIIT